MSKKPHAIDVHAGSRVRMRRMMLGISQEKLAAGLGVSFQQVQKNEKGTNRMGASRLQQIADVLQVEVSFFFEGRPGFIPTKLATAEHVSPSIVSEFCATRDGLTLIKSFAAIDNAKTRQHIVRLIEQIAEP